MKLSASQEDDPDDSSGGDSSAPQDHTPTAPTPGDGDQARTSGSGSGDPVVEIFGLDAPVDSDRYRLVGTTIGNVRIIRLIGEGGMGQVYEGRRVFYEGRQKHQDRTVAVKVMRPGPASPEMVKRFMAEPEILGQLQQRGIAQI